MTPGDAPMIELLALATLAVVAAGALALVGVIALVLKLVFWVVLLPFRLFFKAAGFALGALFGGLGLLAGVVVVPLLLLVVAGAVVAAIVSALVALLIPAVPFVLLGLLVWSLVRKPAPASV
jgi:hypothetical protein